MRDKTYWYRRAKAAEAELAALRKSKPEVVAMTLQNRRLEAENAKLWEEGRHLFDCWVRDRYCGVEYDSEDCPRRCERRIMCAAFEDFRAALKAGEG